MEWVKNLAVCMILFSAILRILPKNHFEKYIRFYTGLLVLILVIRPLLSVFSLDDSLPNTFLHYMEQMEDDTLKKQMEEVNKKRNDHISDQMEGQVKETIIDQVETYGKSEGVIVSDCQVIFDMEENSDTYGQVSSVSLLLREDGEEGLIHPPVTIVGERIEVKRSNISENGAEEAFAAGKKDTGKLDKIEEVVREKVANMFLLDGKQVSVEFES